MAFLPKFADRTGYTDANIYQFERRPERPYNPTSSVSFEYREPVAGRDYAVGLQSRGLIDQVGNRGNSRNPTEGLLSPQSKGIQNITGFGQQEGTNVVYDQGPEQFEKNLKLQREALGVERMKAEGILEQNRALNESRMQNADANMLRAQMTAYRAQHPNAVFKETLDGIVAIDPQTNEVTRLGVQGLKMGERDRLGLQQENELARIGARGDESMELARFIQQAIGGRQESQQNFERNKTIYTEDGKTYRTQGDPVEAATKLFNMRPDLAPYIQFSEDGKRFTVNAPGKMTDSWFGDPTQDPSSPTAAQHAEILKSIYGGTQGPKPQFPQNAPAINSTPGGSVPNVLGNQLQLKPEQMQGFGSGLGLSSPPQPGQQSGFQAAPGQFTAKPGQFNAQPTSPAAQAAAAQGKKIVKMIAPDGGELEVPEDQVQAMIAQGATVAGQGPAAAGQVNQGGPRAGQVTGPSAGTLGGRSAGSVR